MAGPDVDGRVLETTATDLRQVARTHGTIADAAGFDGYRSFGYIRHPLDWLGSAWAMRMFIINIAGNERRPDDPPGRNEWLKTLSFADWVRERRTTPMDWLEDGGLRVDEIRRFEDFAARSPVHANATRNRPNYLALFDDDLLGYVAVKCRREIEIGGYELDRCR